MDNDVDNEEEEEEEGDKEEEGLNDESPSGWQSVGDMDTNTNTSTGNDEKIDSSLIKKILIEMKSEFARGVPNEIDSCSDKVETDTEDRSKSTEAKHDSNFTTFKVSDIINLKAFGTAQDTSDDEESKNCDSKVPEETDSHDIRTDDLEETRCKGPSKCSSKTSDNGDNLKSEDIADSSSSQVLSTKAVEENLAIEKRGTTETRRKRSLRNQNASNTKESEDDNNSPLGVKRSSRRFSKEYKCESVLQNAIARKEKSFSSLNSSEDRNSKRGHRSPRRSSNNGSTTSNADSTKSSSSVKASSTRSKSQKPTVSPPSSTPITSSEEIENQQKIVKSTNYDEKLQNTIDQLKSTIEQSDIIIDKKIQEISDEPVFDSTYNKSLLSLKIEQEEEIESTLSTSSTVKKEITSKVDRETIKNSSEKESRKLKTLKTTGNAYNDNDNKQRSPIKKKNRYFKGLKYTIKGGHVKSSSRTLSARFKRFETEKSSETHNVVEKQEKELVDEDDNLKVKTIEETDDSMKTEDLTIIETDEREHDISKRMLSIFGVSHAPGVDLLPDSKKEEISLNGEDNEDNPEETDNSVKQKRKFSLSDSPSYEKRSRRDVCESPDCGEVAPTMENDDLKLPLETTPPPIVGVFTESLGEEKKALCLCNANDPYYPSPSCKSEFYCQAIDSLDERLIGCCNTVDIASARLVRSSMKLPYALLCEVHNQRLQRHNSCPGCGTFCTQGIFVQCKFGHHFHKDCQLSYGSDGNSGLVQSPSKNTEKQLQLEEKPTLPLLCLHCGSDSFYDVNISLGAHKYPVFLPLQKPPKQVPSARMSFAGCQTQSEEIKIDIESDEDRKYDCTNDSDKTLLPAVSLVLPSGLKITSDGLPDTALKDKLDKLLHVACSVSAPPSGRFTLRTMYQAAKSGDAEKLIHMLASGLNPNHQFREWVMGTALHAACYSGHIVVVHVLIQAGSDIDILDREQNTPLMISVFNNRNDIVKYLVKAGAEVSFKGGDGMTALHLAAKSGNLEACHYLLSNLNAPRYFIDSVDDGRWTPLVWAAEHCHIDVVRFLLRKRADPLVRDAEQNIALHWAALAGSVEITEALLNYGSEINSTNAHGDAALHIAARQNAYSCTVLLLSRGARTDMRNRAGFSPLECCMVQDSPAYNVIKLNLELKAFSTARRISRILTNDITRGHEANPIQCVNAFDDEGIPTDFTYIIENCFTSNIAVDRTITSLQFCKCRNDCCTTGCCTCGKISIRCWYDNDSKLLPEFDFKDPPMLFECNRACLCSKVSCKNRVVQHGIKARFQLFKTSTNKGWGVRTLRVIPKGSYVCEYIGEIITDCEADTREDDSYLFDLDNRDGETYCIDARRYGNISRFINHMCVPNLLPVRVFIDHQDLHFPRIAFFSNRDIQANEELGFDYGEKFWIIKCKSFTCTCGSERCRYSDTSIQQTLEDYQKRLKQEDDAMSS